MNFIELLYKEVFAVINDCTYNDVYSISFFVHTNEDVKYKGIPNFPMFSISFNRESYLADYDEDERWDFACWEQDEIEIIHPISKKHNSELLYQWFCENGITDIGQENEDDMYDENMVYIGKGPKGYYELICAISDIAKKLQQNGVIKDKFGKIPIIVHDYELCWLVKEATANANPNGEAEEFLIAIEDYI